METLINKITAKILYFFTNQISIFLDNLSILNLSVFQIILDVSIISILFFMAMRWVQGRRAMQIIMGIIFLGIIYSLSVIFELIALQKLFTIFFPALIVAIPIVFQHELRRGLEQLGQKGFFTRNKTKQQTELIETLVETSETLRLQRKGALIVLEKFVPLKDYIDTGTLLDAIVSSKLLVSIFLSKATLHDGAVILRGNHLIAAGCVLPFSEHIKAMEYGTRHKSALGLSENTDALIIVISEEKREISVAHEGKLITKLSAEKLKSLLTVFFQK